MNKVLVAAGCVLVILGVLLFSFYNLPHRTTQLEYKEIKNELKDKDNFVWEKSWDEILFEWNFSKNDEIIVAVWPNYDWAVPSFPELNGMFLPPNSGQYFKDVKILKVNVTNVQKGNFTTVEIYYVYTDPGFPRIFQDYFGVPNNTGALSLDGLYPKPGTIGGKGVIYLGKVSFNGVYKVTFSMEPQDVNDKKIVGENKTIPWAHPVSPPSMIRLYKSMEVTDYPYRSNLVLLSGASTIIIGGVTIFKGRQRSGHPARLRKNDR